MRLHSQVPPPIDGRQKQGYSIQELSNLGWNPPRVGRYRVSINCHVPRSTDHRSNSLWDEIEDKMMQRIKDKHPLGRSQAVIALARLQVNGEVLLDRHCFAGSTK